MKVSNRWVIAINDMDITRFMLEMVKTQKGTCETLIPRDRHH